ncbi:hypothetical protein B0T17DRAFT_618771 [Bombardia bombarda]|uniref:Uncharacterized protein n=1 Tax=Bombardia bombarda TaxID=252184 RepID=A0AA40BYF2_9PEZI|nr:hypothetical protein B0T17DRAFT_618771 [Bombardia bombarda]
MAQKPQNVNHPEDHPNSSNRTTSSAKDGASAAGSTRQSTNSASGSISTILPRMSDPTPTSASNSESPQPMEKSSSANSHAAAKEGAGGTASPYGTRSRNRTGNPRPNYAEDKDMDVDIFEMYPERREGDPKKAATRQAAASSGAATAAALAPPLPSPPSPPPQSQPAAPRPSNGSSRKPLPGSDGSRHNATPNGTKEHHHHQLAAASPVAAGSATNGSAKSKKRKAEAASNASASQTPSAPSANPPAAPKRSAAAASHNGSVNGSNNTNKRGSSAGGYGETNLLTFESSKARPKNGKMVADDGTVLEVNDHVYLVCEPPGEPYYLGRIMEFLHVKNDASLAVDALRINWYYRPKDIGRKVQDTRLVFATMHSDISPLTSLRGKCQIRHKAEIPDMTAYKRSPDCFWYEKLYDRYIQKNYEVIPTSQIINVPEYVKKVLDERWKFILVEQGRGKELTSAVKTCKRCTGYCASNDSVDCAVCQHTYHMNCVKPPLLKKPSRGFAWSCAACSRAQERKLEARNTPNVLDPNYDPDEEETFDDEDDDVAGIDTGCTSRTSPAGEDAHEPATAEQIYQTSLWPYRYLGIHCKVEDALDYDDRIFPRASTRLGPRHQAVVLPWPGRPVEYVKPLEFKKSGRKDGKLNKEMQAALEAERIKKETRPKWVQDAPPGWVQRGGDDTVTLLYKPPEYCGVSMPSEAIDEYMDKASSMAVSLGLPPRSTNLQDVARDLLFRNEFDPEKALKELPKVPKATFEEPELTPAEQKKFEEGVSKFGSELYSVKKHVKTLAPATVTRYYYTWKKTERGKQIWGNYSARKGKKDAKKAEAAANKLADDVADDVDDSAFDSLKAREKKKGFICKFCSTKTSRQWRRAPNASAALVVENNARNSNKEKSTQYIQALCRRCAELWRRYAIQWEDVDEVAKKVAQTGGRGWRRKVDEELYKELLSADEMMSNTRYSTPDPAVAASPAGSLSVQQPVQEPPRKKLKSLPDKDPDQTASDSGSIHGAPVAAPKKKEKVIVEKPPPPPPPPPPPVPEIPKPRMLPCAICREMEPLGDQHLSCRECRLTVHRNCYGITDNRAPGKWTCEMCLNDKNPQVSIHYKCVLCPVEVTEHDFVGPPKVATHKKKTEKDRERERIERENAQKAADYYRKRQEDMNRPVDPREPLKRTADNNWIHVTCAVWTPEVKFGNAKSLGPSEGIPSISRARYAEVCKVCKKDGAGACVYCHHCHASVHVECAHQAGYILGFDITPVKGSRRDQFSIVSINGDTGTMSASVWCKDHVPTKTIIHQMRDVVDDSGMNALQLYVQNFKQADLTLTGCARKANQMTLASSRMSTPASTPATQQNRRSSTATLVNGDHRDTSSNALQPGGKICLTCGVDTTPKWHPIDQEQERDFTNGYFGNLGSEAQKFVEQRSFQCHKCKKAKRQPNPHPQPPKEPTPTPTPTPAPEPVRQLSQAPVAVPSPPAGPTEPRHSSRGPYGWPQVQATAPPPPPPPPPALAQPVPLQAAGPNSMAAPIMSPSVQAAPVAPPPLPPTIAPRAPIPPLSFGPATRPYNDWHRPSTGHSQHSVHSGHSGHSAHSAREMNGGPSPQPHNSMPPLAPPNHLRPQSISNISHPAQPPPAQNGHMAQPPYMNGMPPSPRRHSGPPPSQNGTSYMASPQHGHIPMDLRPHHMSMNQMPPVVQGPMESTYHRQWNHAPPPHHGSPHHGTSHHGSPPLSRESISMGREPSIPPPQRENRPASGASASPSLRNLLS